MTDEIEWVARMGLAWSVFKVWLWALGIVILIAIVEEKEKLPPEDSGK